ncbi:hypothetical protein G6F56_007620 [Rhizopus delemar]|nr:hypothetical protein G6F56_007620 [Rhizopus delemar]
MRPPSAWFTVGTPAIVTTKSTKAILHTILGAICSIGVINIELRVTEKLKQHQKELQTGHYLNFIWRTLGEMDKNPFMARFYIVMDNAPIHTHNDVDELITSRSYKSICPPPYSPELNPIEQFWSVVMNKVKRGTFSDAKDLRTRIAEACNNVPTRHLKAFVQHSCDQFDKCRNKQPI